MKAALFDDAGRGARRWPDRAIFAGLLFLIISTPLALGSVRRPCFVAMEAAIFGLVIVWAIKVLLERPARANIGHAELRRLAIPSAALALFFLFQLAPMPARILRVISPRTYAIYLVSFPSWPALSPYQGLAEIWSGAGAGAGDHGGELPPADSAGAGGIRAARSGARRRAVSALLPRGIDGMRWRTLSLSPSVSASALIEGMALGALGFLIIAYPFGLIGEREAENRLRLGIMLAIIGAAAAVALLGLAERTWWNGKILWFYVPKDWSGPLMTSAPRASGPFVDADHFANYLEMALPLALMGAIFGLPGASRRRDSDIRLFCAVSACLLLAGIVLSLSRGGWTAMVVGVCAAIWMSVTRAREEAPAFVRRIGIRAVPLTLAAAALLFGLVLFLIGPGGREQTGERIGATIVQADSLRYRPAVWRDTLSMIADFPVFGVGLGCWPDLFPHYQRPPWMPFFFRETENDYLQFTAEAGLAGLGLLIWLAAAVSRRLWTAARNLPRRRWPAFAGLTAGLGAAMLHEAVDFSLHTPANALLFTVALALTLRIALMDGSGPASRASRPEERGKSAYLKAASAGGAAAAMIAAAFAQNGAVYPYDMDRAGSLVRAEANLAAHPAAALAHLTLAARMPADRREAGALRQRELAAAVWLDPNDPDARDFYARALMVAGDKRGGLRQISRSVYRAPQLYAHYYLEPGLIPWLLPQEQDAIAAGFERAIERGFQDSADNLGTFYLELGRYKDAADVYAAAAMSASGAARIGYLLKAGEAYAQLQDVATAAAMFAAAARIDPSDARPYEELAGDIFERAGDAAGAKAAIDAGVRQGADPYTLEMALADSAWHTGDLATAEDALERALKYDPTFAATMSLGAVYLARNKSVRAVLTFQRAAEMNPGSADAFFNLAEAQERDFEYFEAAKSYARAAALAPHDADKRNAYLAFQERTAESARQAVDDDVRAAGVQPSEGRR